MLEEGEGAAGRADDAAGRAPTGRGRPDKRRRQATRRASDKRRRQATRRASDEPKREMEDHLSAVDERAIDRFVLSLQRSGVAHELRLHEPARHARHLASIWGVLLREAGRATLFDIGGACVLALVPADRKVSAPRLRAALGVSVLRVLRGDRGVGRVGWSGLPGEPGALPAVPQAFGARCVVEELVLRGRQLVVSLGGGRSVALRPEDYVRAAAAEVARFAGTTRLLPEGGMVEEGSMGDRQ